ncbi:MAG: LamG domain-containing protein [archaeon]
MKKIGDRKAQSAMEYILTYGWAILVVLVAVSALFYLGVFSPRPPNNCGITAPFICKDVIANENSVGLLLGGSGVSSVQIASMKLNGKDCVTAESNGKGGQLYADTSLSNINNQLTMVRCVGITNTVGQKISAEINVNYVSAQTGLSHVITGYAFSAGETGRGTFDQSHVLDSSMVLNYDFESVTTGSKGVNDLSGKNNLGTLNGAGGLNFCDNVGKFGKGCLFNNINTYISVDDSDTLDFTGSEEFSIELWVYASSINTDAIILKTTGITFPPTPNGYGFYLVSNRLRYIIGDGSVYRDTDLGIFSTLSWKHIVAVFDRPSTVNFYVNGQLQTVATPSFGDINNNQNLYLGMYSSSNFFEGKLDSVVIYNRVLSPEEIRDHYCYTEKNIDITNCNTWAP